MSTQNDWHFRLRAHEYFLCQAFHTIPRETGAYISTFCILLCRSIHASFVDFFLMFLFHYKMTTKAKLTFTQKRMTVELENQEDGLD